MSLNEIFEQVKKFHIAFDHPVHDKPKLLSPDRVKSRSDWMIEEIKEFIDSDTVEEQADAMIDLIYFAVGTLVEMGVPPQKLFDIVQEANMSKIWPDGKPHFRKDGKVIKPEGWIDPKQKLEIAISSMRGEH